MKYSDWIPVRKTGRGINARKNAWESPNKEIWLSYGGYPVQFHVSFGPLDIMWLGGRRSNDQLRRNQARGNDG
jgi:hypothetical protein